MKIEITRYKTEIHREVFTFWLKTDFYGTSPCRIVFDKYVDENKESTRKKTWNANKVYQRLGPSRIRSIDYEDVFIPPDVIKELKQKICDTIWELPISKES